MSYNGWSTFQISTFGMKVNTLYIGPKSPEVGSNTLLSERVGCRKEMKDNSVGRWVK